MRHTYNRWFLNVFDEYDFILGGIFVKEMDGEYFLYIDPSLEVVWYIEFLV
jgi:hypothetical protein